MMLQTVVRAATENETMSRVGAAIESTSVDAASRTLNRALQMLLATVALIISLAVLLPASRALASCDPSMSLEVIRLINIERVKVGLPVVKENSRLMGLATLRAEEASRNFSHTRPNGAGWATIFAQWGVDADYRGENLAFGQTSARAVVQAWMDSPEHRANILDEAFDTAAVGIWKRNGMLYFCHLFMRAEEPTLPDGIERMVFAGRAVSAGHYAQVIDRDLKVRAAGSAHAEVLAVVDRGSALSVLEVRQGWARVETADGMQGWASVKYLMG